MICRKDTASLIESTILPRLTAGLLVVATYPLHICKDAHGNILCLFSQICPTTEHTIKTIRVKLYVTGDLAFQAMSFGKEPMLGHWCMQCTMQMQCTLTLNQMNAVKRWTMEEYCRLGDEAEKQKGEPKLGVKKKPWWPFIPVTLKRNVALRSLLASSEDSANNAANADAEAEENKLRALEEFRNKFVEKLVKARRMVSDQQLKLKAMRTLKVKDHGSIETKIFSVLKEIGVELSAYHGGSLNGKDIKKVMNIACHIFDRFSTIFKGGEEAKLCAVGRQY